MRAGLGLLAAGWLLNAVAILPNGGMPVSTVAVDAAGAPPRVQEQGRPILKHVPATDASVAALLGDVIPVRPLGTVLSGGDLLLLLGVGVCVSAASKSAMGVASVSEGGGRAATGERSAGGVR